MLHAVTRHKVPSSLRRKEDVLTSCVFGTLDLIPAELGLGPWLRSAQNLEGDSLDVADSVLDERQTRFWPRFPLDRGERVEPDLTLDCGELTIIIEAKYGSGPSGMPTEDDDRLCGQLGRQWRAVRAQRPEHVPHSIYVTAGWSMPREDMEAMIVEVETKMEGEAMRSNLYWLTWRTLFDLLPKTVEDPFHTRAVDGLRGFLRSRDLTRFIGVSRPPLCSAPSWRYPNPQRLER